jgi:hypothetical protein
VGVFAFVVAAGVSLLFDLSPSLQDIAANHPDGHGWVSVLISFDKLLYYFVFEQAIGLAAISITMTVVGLLFSYVPSLRNPAFFVLLALCIGFVYVPLYFHAGQLTFPTYRQSLIVALVAVLSYFFGPYSSNDAAKA